MGQCYWIDAKLLFADKAEESAFCEAVRRKIDELSGLCVTFNIEEGNHLRTPLECLKALTRDGYELPDKRFQAGFDGSYGWEGVVLEVLYEACHHLGEGSEILFCPDSCDHCIKVKDGRVEHYYETYWDTIQLEEWIADEEPVLLEEIARGRVEDYYETYWD